MINKIYSFLKSFRYIKLEDDFRNIIFGPEAKLYLKYFKKNYYYIEPTKETIINLKLILPCLFNFFLYLIKKPKLTIKYLKISPRLFFIISLIKIKKIKKTISLVDYNEWPNVIKEFLGNEIYSIGVQTSLRAHPLNRVLLAKDFNNYYYWNEFKDSEKKKLNSTKIYPLGALKSCLVVNDKSLWNIVDLLPESSSGDKKKNLVLISTMHETYIGFFEKFLSNKSEADYDKIILDLENKCLNNKLFGKIKFSNKKEKVPRRMFYFQPIEFFKMCIFIKRYINEEDVNLSIIERNKIGTRSYEFEKKFFQNFFGKDLLTNLEVFEKIEYIVNNRNHVFLTNISSMGKEALALNRKSFFFSTLLHFYNPDFFEKKSNFFSINDQYGEFKKSLTQLFDLTGEKFSKNKMDLKPILPSCSITKKNFKDFLLATDLELN